MTSDNRGRGKRLWIQSGADLTRHEGYADALRKRAQSIVGPDVGLRVEGMPDEVIAGKVPRERVIAAFEATVRALEPSEFEAVIPAEAFLATSLGTGPVQLADSAVPVLDGFAMGFAFVQALMALSPIATMQTSRAGRYAHVDYARASHVRRVLRDGM